MRTSRALLLTGTILPTLLAPPAPAWSGPGAVGRVEIAQTGAEREEPRGGGPRGGAPGVERGGPAERGGGGERERPEPRAGRPDGAERGGPPEARERPGRAEPREERGGAPTRERPPGRPEPREERPRERPEPQGERPVAKEREERAREKPQEPRSERPADQLQPSEGERRRRDGVERRGSEERRPGATPDQRREPDAPTPPTRPDAPVPARPTPPAAGQPRAVPPPAAPDRPDGPGRPPAAPTVGPDRTAPPAAAPGRPTPPNQAPGVPGRPFTPPDAREGADRPDPVERRDQQRGDRRPGDREERREERREDGPRDGGQDRDRPDRDGGDRLDRDNRRDRSDDRLDRDSRRDRGEDARDRDRRDEERREGGRRDGFNAPGRPGYVPGGFRGDDDTRSYEDVRRSRREFVEDGRTYIREPGRIIVRDRDAYFIRHDENERFRGLGGGRFRTERRGSETYSYIDRPGGEQIVTIVDDDGRLLRRSRRFRDGREVILIDNARRGGPRPIDQDVVDLPPPDIRIPRERYVVDYDGADERTVYETLTAPPVEAVSRRYTLDQVRYSPQLRARMRSVDIDTVTFDTASYTVNPEQVARLATIATAIKRAVEDKPQEVFLVEGYTDAVGADVDNLSLSDRRAQSVATVLTQEFQVPPENLTTQGYGEQYLKVNTQDANRENRRVTVRRITPLLQQESAEAPERP